MLIEIPRLFKNLDNVFDAEDKVISHTHTHTREISRAFFSPLINAYFGENSIMALYNVNTMTGKLSDG